MIDNINILLLINPELEEIIFKLIKCLILSSDLRKPKWKSNENPLAGHCYIASEVLKYLLGNDWKSEVVNHEGGTHWYLRHKPSNEVLDITASQFKSKVPYHLGKGCGFLTKNLSKRATELLRRFKNLTIQLV